MPTCIVCMDDMDMEEFNDPRERTETCFKLACGHAYHTGCLVNFLQNTNHRCAHCNNYRAPEARNRMRGLVDGLLRELDRDPEMRALKAEYKEAEKELREATFALQEDVRQFIAERMDALAWKDKRAYAQKCERALKTHREAAAREKGPEYVGALRDRQRHDRDWVARHRRYNLYHPRLGSRP
jgi:exonuclease VII large subunit